jgi:hypothetical protein
MCHSFICLFATLSSAAVGPRTLALSMDVGRTVDSSAAGAENHTPRSPTLFSPRGISGKTSGEINRQIRLRLFGRFSTLRGPTADPEAPGTDPARNIELV